MLLVKKGEMPFLEDILSVVCRHWNGVITKQHDRAGSRVETFIPGFF
jgi:hypothetical protein